MRRPRSAPRKSQEDMSLSDGQRPQPRSHEVTHTAWNQRARGAQVLPFPSERVLFERAYLGRRMVQVGTQWAKDNVQGIKNEYVNEQANGFYLRGTRPTSSVAYR